MRSVAKVVGIVLGVVVVPAMLCSWLLLGGNLVLWVASLFGAETFLGFDTGPLDMRLIVFAVIATGAGWLLAKLLDYARVL